MLLHHYINFVTTLKPRWRSCSTDRLFCQLIFGLREAHLLTNKRSILYLLHWSRRFRGCYEIKAPPWDVSARMRASGTTHAAHSLAVKSAKGRKNTFTFFGQILFLPPSFLPSLFSSFRNVTAAWDALVRQQEKAAVLILCQFATILTFKADATLSQLLAVCFDDCGNHLCFKVTIFTYIATRWCHLCKALVLQGFSFAIYFRTFYGMCFFCSILMITEKEKLNSE